MDRTLPFLIAQIAEQQFAQLPCYNTYFEIPIKQITTAFVLEKATSEVEARSQSHTSLTYHFPVHI